MLALLAAAALVLEPAGHPELVRSPDRSLLAWNYDTGKSGDVPRWIVTLRWMDGTLPREQVLVDDSPDRLGWVEAIGRYESNLGPAYLIVSEDKVGARRYATVLSAWKMVSGLATLQPFSGFFSAIPGVRYDDDSEVRWEYERDPGPEVFPRPIEARLEPEGVRLALFPDWEKERSRSLPLARMKRRETLFRLQNGALVLGKLPPEVRAVIDKPVKPD